MRARTSLVALAGVGIVALAIIGASAWALAGGLGGGGVPPTAEASHEPTPTTTPPPVPVGPAIFVGEELDWLRPDERWVRAILPEAADLRFSSFYAHAGESEGARGEPLV